MTDETSTVNLTINAPFGDEHAIRRALHRAHAEYQRQTGGKAKARVNVQAWKYVTCAILGALAALAGTVAAWSAGVTP